MRDTKSMILGEDGGGKVKIPPAPVVQKKDVKPSVVDVVNPVDPLPASGNGYAQAAAQVNTVNDAIQGSAPVRMDDAPVAPAFIPTEQPKVGSMEELVNRVYSSRMPTEEELAKEKKRERSRQVIAAIADGASAISNLYFTGKGAPNVEQTSMSAANAKRYQAILDRRIKIKDELGRARLAAYDRDRGLNYQIGKDKKTDERSAGEWDRTGKWHDDAVAREDAIRKDEKERRDRADKEAKAIRDREFDAQEKARKDASARGWAVVSAQNKRVEAQEKKQKEQSKYLFEKANGAPEPKRIGSNRSIYVGRNTWEQKAH